MISRRMVVLGGVLGLAGCGFRPVYGVGQPGGASLAAVFVEIIPNRSGQLLRQALQARLEGTNGDVAKRFTLAVGYGESVQSLGVQSDNSTTRNRDVGTAAWALHRVDGELLSGGSVRTVDGYNVLDGQFFYQDLSEDATDRRMAQALADQITLALGLYFDKHPG